MKGKHDVIKPTFDICRLQIINYCTCICYFISHQIEKKQYLRHCENEENLYQC